MKLPNFLVIGPPRTGTTWLFRTVSRHPQVYVPEEKQIHFFDRHYDNGLEWYGDMFKNAPESATATEEHMVDRYRKAFSEAAGLR